MKLEKENDETQRARTLLEKARAQAGTERVWMQSAIREYECNLDHEYMVDSHELAHSFLSCENMYML